jgi:hypothetical protein
MRRKYGRTNRLDVVVTLHASLHCTKVGLVEEQEGEQWEGIIVQVKHDLQKAMTKELGMQNLQ